MARLSELRGQYVQSFGRVAQLVDANDHEPPPRCCKRNPAGAGRLAATHQRLAGLAEKLVEVDNRAVVSNIRSAHTLMLVLGAAGLLIGVVLSTGITRSITLPLRRAVAVARRVADGDLGSRIEVIGSDETSELA